MIVSETCMIESRWRTTPGEATARLPERGSGLDKRLLGNGDFFASKSLSELAREQGVRPIDDIRVFAGGIPEDEDVDEMLDEIYRLRQP